MCAEYNKECISAKNKNDVVHENIAFSAIFHAYHKFKTALKASCCIAVIRFALH